MTGMIRIPRPADPLRGFLPEPVRRWVPQERWESIAVTKAEDPAPVNPAGHFPYIYRWNRQGRKGQCCEVLTRGKMNSCRVRFADGYVMITSRNALMRKKDD